MFGLAHFLCRHQNEHFLITLIVPRRIEQTLVHVYTSMQSKFHSTFNSSGFSTLGSWLTDEVGINENNNNNRSTRL